MIRTGWALGLVAAAVGATILLGWALDVPRLKSFFPEQVEAKANGGVCLLFLGLALAWKAGRRTGRQPRLLLLANGCAAVAALLGLGTVLEYVLKRDLGIDNLLFQEASSALATVHPGRMALPAAINFLLLGCAIVLLDTGRSRAIVGWLTLPTALAAITVFIAQLYGVPELAAMGPFTPVPVPVGLTFLLLGAGVVAAGCAGNLLRSTRLLRNVGFAFALLLLLVMGGAVVRSSHTVVANTHLVTHTYEVMDRLSRIQSAVGEAESAARGYVLTGDRRFLAPAESVPQRLAADQQELRSLTADNPAQQHRLDELEKIIWEKQEFSRNQVKWREQGEESLARATLSRREGLELMDRLRTLIETMRQAELSLLAERQARVTSSTALTMLSLGIGLGSSIFVITVVFVMFKREIAGRRRTEQSLRRSEESLAVTMNSIGDAVMATDTSGRVRLLNPVAQRLTGWTLDEARGRPVDEVFHIIQEVTRAPAVIPVNDVLRTGAVHGLASHTILIARDGTERMIEDSAAPILDAEQRILGVVLVFRDVTESRRAQLELDRFFSLSIDFLGISSTDGYFKRVSTGVTDMLGWTVEEFLAQPFTAFLHPDDVARTQAKVAEQMQTGTRVLEFENRYRHKDGSWRTLSWRSVPVPGSGLMYATARDVTASREAEARIWQLNGMLKDHARQLEEVNASLRESRAELESLFRSLPGLYLVLTPDFRIVTASDAYLKATLTDRDAIQGRGLFEVFPDNPDDPAADGTRNLEASLRRVLELKISDTMAIQKYDIRRPDGTFEERYWSPINSPLFGADGRITYIIHRVEDVTEFVRQRQAGKSPDTDLQKRLLQMEAEIFQSAQKIQQVNEQLRAANQELEAFSYSVSHDLRAPLRHVQGYVEMLTREAEGQLSEKARRFLRTIGEAAKEMGVLIDDLLAFSRMGRTELRDERVDLNGLIEEVRRGLEFSTKDRPIQWELQKLPEVRGDQPMLRQVLTNLLSNAVKYTRGRDPAVIRVGTAGREEGREVFFVQDNGAGFDMKYADKLFGVFQRLHRADEFEGTGIGLASVRRIVSRHGGRTWAEGKLGEGATFYFTLRLADNPVPPAHRP